jgi:asparagine synthetase B (glutamine-hydrolysing)
MTDKDFCLSSYISFRYIWKEGKDFYNGLRHENFQPVSENNKVYVKTAEDIYNDIRKQFDQLYAKYENIGILLSGGMDSANLAHFLKPGSHAYTFTSDTGVFNADVERASYYCRKFNLQHHLINISFEDYKHYTPIVMAAKGAPVHSIEPQIFKAAIMAQNDGVELLIVGESADLIFGGMDQLISRDWNFDDFAKRYTFLEPSKVLTTPVDMSELYETYRLPEGKIDYMKFMDEVFSIESSSSYMNAFAAARMPYYDPYARMMMSEPLDMHRVRNGEPKYLVRELFSMIYPELEIPFKIPMPRPVDAIFKEWSGPTRAEFRKDIDMNTLTGNQKWQLWCAELFLDIFEPEL